METPEINELATLRQTVAELTAKNTARKARITELEASVKTLQTSLTGAQTALYQAEVGEPLQTLANAISPVPELFLSEFARLDYKVAKTDGKLILMQNDKPVQGAEFTVAGLTKLLAKSDEPAHKNFKHLIIASRASGGGATVSARTVHGAETKKTTETPNAKPQFGLR
jgi:phage shock protein A